MAPSDMAGLDVLSLSLEVVLTASEQANTSRGTYMGKETRNDDSVIPLKVATAELIEVVNDLNLASGGLLSTYNSLHWNLSNFVTTTIAKGARFHVCSLREVQSTPMCAKYPVLREVDQSGALGVGKRELDDIKQELQILCHKPVQEHRNIVKIQGLGWMDVGTPGLLVLPVLFLEQAHLGSLEVFLNLNHPGPRLRASLVKDVANGLLALHSSGIIHGDLKPENILICLDESRSLVAKIADFGSSNIASALFGAGEHDLDEEVHQGRGASALWNAPEWRELMSLRTLFSCDVYSFGLLAWSICTAVPNPFGFLDMDAIEMLKSQNLVIHHASRAVQDYYAFESAAWGPEVPYDEVFELYLMSVVLPRNIFINTLDAEPLRRSLQEAVAAASPDNLYGFANETDFDVEKTVLIQRKALIKYSALKNAPLSARRLLIEGFKLSAADSKSPRESRGQFCFQIAMAQIDGLCSSPDHEEAVDWLLKAAELGFYPARGIVRRLYNTFKPYPAHGGSDLEAKLMLWLTDAAGLGTPFGLKYLQGLDEISYQAAKKQSLAKHQPQLMIASLDFTPDSILEILFSADNIETNLARLGTTANDFFLNEKRDTLLHFGAAYGVSMDKFTAFMDTWTPDIDQQNEAGDTPLLSAMRAGKSEHAMTLLRRGAKGDIHNKRGQTPCHWIIQFDDSVTVDRLLARLHSAHADFSSVADREDLDPTVHYIAVPFKGTPLHWAVLHGHAYAVGALLRQGADPLQIFTDSSLPSASAIDLALKLWEHELVGPLIDFCGDRFNPRMLPHADGAERLPPWLRNGTTNWTILPMMTLYHWQPVWHGADCLKALAQTLDELGRRGLAQGDLDYILAFAMMTYPLDPLEVIFNFYHDFITADLLDRAFSLSGFQFRPGTVRFLFERLITAEDAIGSAAEKFVFSFVCSGASDEFVLQRATEILGKVDVRDENGDTLFALAVRNGNFDAATELLRLGADVNALLPAKNEQTSELDVNILHELILHNNDSVVSALNYLLEPHHPFKEKVPSFVVNRRSGITALQLASKWDCDAVFQTILRHFGDEQSISAATEKGFTALHLASFAGQLTHVRLLCETSADLNARTAEGLTSRDVCHSTALFVSSNNMRPVAYWESVLIRRLHIDAYLRKQGGTTSLKGSAMKMPIGYRFLRESIASDFPRLFDEALAMTPNQLRTQPYLDALLFFAVRKGTANTVRRLLHAGADACARSASAATPLHTLARRQIYLVVKLKTAWALLLAGADTRAKDAAGRSPLAVAYSLGDRGMVRFLLSGVHTPALMGEPGKTAQVKEDESDDGWLAKFEAVEKGLRILADAARNQLPRTGSQVV